ncbi:phosphate-starvation-inducible PsiE family protein [Pseudanabaena sp. PCC 6802]|uniref:phosphate-starvation-inducible PsiE family protein n=1 Tax=Pseudanabaena sp. PCC 6802 TaxID=118173 RepID=UPI000346FCD9
MAIAFEDNQFLHSIERIENLVSKVLAIAMVVVTLVAVGDLCIYLSKELFAEPLGFFTTSLITIFGLFLNILIALEILENITAYLRKHVIQLELVIVTSLTAVARKIIIFDSKAANADIAGLALAVLCLAIGYWIVRWVNRNDGDREH